MFGLGWMTKIFGFKFFYSANLWMEGNGSDALEGGDTASTIDNKVTAALQDPLDRLLANYRKGCSVTYASATTVSVAAGEVTLANTDDTIRRMRKNVAAVAVDITSDIDTGSEAASTWYYVWAVADADATTFTCKLSTSSTFPTGVTYAAVLGKLYNNSDSDIKAVQNIGLGAPVLDTWASKSDDTVYQAATDGFVCAHANFTNGAMSGYTDGNNPPTTVRTMGGCNPADSADLNDGITMPVKTGDYWKVTVTGYTGTPELYWLPFKTE